MRPLLLKLGLAVAFSLAGYLRLRLRRSLSLPSHAPTTGLQFLITQEAPTNTNTIVVTEMNELERKILDTAMEQEIAHLRDLVNTLQGRERTLESQMLELQGLREQGVALKELENRLKIAATESKLHSMKIESLQDENQRLLAQLSDSSSKLESARDQIRLLNRKLILVGEQAKEEIAALQQKLATLQDKWLEAEAELRSKRSDELEVEDGGENSELKLKLKSHKADPTSNAAQLGEENDTLKEDTTDHFADVEELEFLKWMNEWLQHKMMNYQSPPWKSVAKGPRESFSPQSGHNAKQLLLDYENFGTSKRSMSFTDCSSSRASTEEHDDAFVDNATFTTEDKSSRKSKFIKRLKKLVLRKEYNRINSSIVHKTPASCGHSERISPIEDLASGIGLNFEEQHRN